MSPATRSSHCSRDLSKTTPFYSAGPKVFPNVFYNEGSHLAVLEASRSKSGGHQPSDATSLAPPPALTSRAATYQTFYHAIMGPAIEIIDISIIGSDADRYDAEVYYKRYFQSFTFLVFLIMRCLKDVIHLIEKTFDGDVDTVRVNTNAAILTKLLDRVTDLNFRWGTELCSKPDYEQDFWDGFTGHIGQVKTVIDASVEKPPAQLHPHEFNSWKLLKIVLGELLRVPDPLPKSCIMAARVLRSCVIELRVASGDNSPYLPLAEFIPMPPSIDSTYPLETFFGKPTTLTMVLHRLSDLLRAPLYHELHTVEIRTFSQDRTTATFLIYYMANILSDAAHIVSSVAAIIEAGNSQNISDCRSCLANLEAEIRLEPLVEPLHASPIKRLQDDRVEPLVEPLHASPIKRFLDDSRLVQSLLSAVRLLRNLNPFDTVQHDPKYLVNELLNMFELVLTALIRHARINLYMGPETLIFRAWRSLVTCKSRLHRISQYPDQRLCQGYNAIY